MLENFVSRCSSRLLHEGKKEISVNGYEYTASGKRFFPRTVSQSSSVVANTLVLVGLPAICRAVGAGQTAVKRWIRDEGFPAKRCTDGTYRADPLAIQRWFRKNI